MAAPNVRWSVTAHAARLVQIWAAPTMTWMANSTAAVPTMPSIERAMAPSTAADERA
jgi:predicted transglutaminase-like cysteine proteinase